MIAKSIFTLNTLEHRCVLPHYFIHNVTMCEYKALWTEKFHSRWKIQGPITILNK